MTERTVPPPATRLETGTPLRVWYGVAGAPLAWVVHSSVAWWVTGRACADGRAGWGALSPGAVRVLLVALGVGALVAGSVALAASLQAWKVSPAQRRLTEAHGHGVAEYLAIAGVLISGSFLLGIFWTTLPAAMVDICQGVR